MATGVFTVNMEKESVLEINFKHVHLHKTSLLKRRQITFIVSWRNKIQQMLRMRKKLVSKFMFDIDIDYLSNILGLETSENAM